MRPLSVVFLLFSCVVAGLSGAILYNYSAVYAGKKQLQQLEADFNLYNKLVAESEQKEKAEVQRREVRPSQMISSGSTFQPEKQRNSAAIVLKIQQNWIIDKNMIGKQCRVNMALSPDGSLNRHQFPRHLSVR